MNRIIKGLKYPIRSGASVHFDMMYEVSADDHFDMIFSCTQPKEAKPVVRNETEIWLYDARCENYERVLDVVKKKTPFNNKFTLPHDQIVSYFHEFLTEYFIKKNLNLQDQLNYKNFR